MTRLVLDLNDRRPVWTIPEWAIAEIRQALPSGWELHVATSEADGSGDGSGRASAEVLEAVRGATAYAGLGIPPEVLRAGAGSLRWVHTGAAGVGSSLTPELRESGVLFTNSAGIHGPPIAETVVAMILHFARGLDLAVRAQLRSDPPRGTASRPAPRWSSAPFLRERTPVREVAGSVVGILGLGGIGREVARRIRPLGARVLGWKRRPAADAEEADELVYGEEGRLRVLGESDYVVVSLPETPRTRGVIGRGALAAMKEGSVLVNVARGRLVDTEALVDALTAGSLRGAALDVCDPEPLPDDHPLWGLPNVLITPHVSAVSRGFWGRQTDLIVGNLRRFHRGEPLRNLVDVEAGY